MKNDGVAHLLYDFNTALKLDKSLQILEDLVGFHLPLLIAAVYLLHRLVSYRGNMKNRSRDLLLTRFVIVQPQLFTMLTCSLA